ncbi:SICAvar type I [Plasmodium knowlesi]|uniref:SICAvar type I n=1 Tax=Plasmodium knowlesi TaxID=5850 RepID=A0A1Y3DKN0_PLAKN|nr:SICAvar type I [Plasmodium knowlesi]
MTTANSGLLEEWLKNFAIDAAQTSQASQTVDDATAAKKITEEMKKDLNKEFDELGKWLTRPESNEIHKFCHDEVDWGGGGSQYEKVLCEGLAEIKYFMNGVETKKAGKGRSGNDEEAQITKLTNGKAYTRCIVGAVALSEIYGDHCKLKEVVERVQEKVTDGVEDKLRNHLEDQGYGNQLNTCQGITMEQLFIGKSILGSTIKEWTKQKRSMGVNGGWRVGRQWTERWPQVCGGKGKQMNAQYLQGLRKESAQHMTKFLKVGDDNMSSKTTTDGKPTLEEILTEEGYTISQDKLTKVLQVLADNTGSAVTVDPSNLTTLMQTLEAISKESHADVCMKQEGKTFCERLQCAEQYWKLNNNGQNTQKDFWEEQVKVKLSSLITKAVDNGDTGGANCNDPSMNSANKAACEHMAKLLNHMYQNANSGTNKYSDQIIKCALLKEYAKKLKDEAQKKGLCDIGSGLEKAFNESKTIMMSASGQCTAGTNGSNSCFECSWDDNDELKSCTVGSDDVKEKVGPMLNSSEKTNQAGLQQTLIAFNTNNTLCERVKCAMNWYKTNRANGATSSDWEEVWNKVKEDVTSLGTAMSNDADNSADTHCSTLSGKNKEICLLFSGGLKKLYSINDGDAATQSFKRTMMCAALNAYANKIKKEAAEKKNCSIENGINGAFSKIDDIMKEATPPCNDANSLGCFKCTWEKDNFNSCQITTTGNPENVNDKLKKMFEDEEDNTGLKESLDKICLPCLEEKELCNRAECVMGRWKANRNGPSGSDPWEEVKTQLQDLSREIEKNKSSVGSHCVDFKEEEQKAVCELIAAGLKSIYEIKAGQDTGKTTKKDLEDQLFKRTMRCVLLNAFADKLESLPCSQEKKVKDAISKAFKVKNDAIKSESDGCKNDGDKCFTCTRVTNLSSCTIKENGNPSAAETKLQTKIDPMFKEDSLGMKKIEDEALKKICKPCTEGSNGDKCTYVECIANKWKTNRKSSNYLLNHMKNTANWNGLTKYCKDKTWKDGDAHGFANETACKLVAAGLEHISKIQHEYSEMTTTTKGQDLNPYDNQEFKQFISCLALKAIVKEMKEKSIICDIDKGIETAFGKANEIKGEHCKNKKPCIECKWTDDYDECSFDQNQSDKVKDKLDSLLKTQESDVNNILFTITKTGGNNSSSLCRRLQCLTSRVNSSTSKDDFWNKDTGEVANLWQELSQAMTTSGTTEHAECSTVDDKGTTGSGRTPTDPERKACNYLHAGFEKLQQLSKPPTSTVPVAKILDKHPSLKQTVGCFLLHAYAKQMKKEAKCLVESGIRKAFDTAVKNLIGSCKGTEPCVPCLWNEDKYGSCQITTTDTSATTTTEPADKKLENVKPNINNTATTTLTEINKTESLCDYIKCAGPKWFKNNQEKNGGGTPTNKTWCQFWEEGVKNPLEDLFKNIESNGKTNNNGVCEQFGDENPHSVERKACNHITAGLEHINTLSDSGNTSRLLDRAVGCIALNMYVDEIIKLTGNSCPIHEDRVTQMFTEWNNNNTCYRSGANKNVCFKCDRVPTSDFKDCKLSVSETLVDTTTAQGGTCKTDATEVKTKMEGLLFKDNPSKSISKVKSTLSTITDTKSSFCTQLQCAAKQYYAKVKSPGANSSKVSWAEINNVVESELKTLLEYITNDGNWESASGHCNDIGLSPNGDTPGEITAKQKACKLFALGLKHISDIKNKNNNKSDEIPLKQTMMCAALNLYADQLIKKSTNQCPLDNEKLNDAIKHAFQQSKDIMGKGATQCGPSNNGVSSCFVCNREENTFNTCKIGNDKIKDNMTKLLDKEDETNPDNNKEKTLEKINKIETFCTQVQCAIKQHYRAQNGQTLPNGKTPYWDTLSDEIGKELTELLEDMNDSEKQSAAERYCNDNNPPWYKLGHKEKRTNKAACLHFVAGLQHIYNQKKVSVKGQFKGPSFEQTMGCLFLKEYAKQLKDLANEKKKGNSWVHPHCSIEDGINHAFEKSNEIMQATPPCKDTKVPNSCFVCIQNEKYDDCLIGKDKVQDKVESIFQDEPNKNHMQQTLENTVCPILLTDLLTPFLPLAPVSIGLSAMAYYLWKYFGPLGKGGTRFRRSPADIPGPLVQEQVLDHVQQDSSHEYQLVKERKPRSAPTRTKRSGPVNRRTIIEIHFEVLDECQKGDTQLAQKDFLELLVQEFMGSELMEEEQVPKEGVSMESVPMELVPIEEVPSLGSVFMV